MDTVARLHKNIKSNEYMFCGSFCPSGKQIVTGDYKGGIHFWDVDTGSDMFHMSGDINVKAVATCSTGDRVVSGDNNGAVILWDTESKQRIKYLGKHTYDGIIPAYVNSVALHPDNDRIASGGEDGIVRLYVVSANTQIQLKYHSKCVYSVVFKPGGTHLAISSGDKTACVYDTVLGKPVLYLNGHRSHVASVAYNPDGSQLVSGGEDKTIRIWDARSGNETQRLVGHECWVNGASFSPDNNYVISASGDHTTRLWDLRMSRQLGVYNHPGIVYSTAFSPDGRRFFSCGTHMIRIWDMI